MVDTRTAPSELASAVDQFLMLLHETSEYQRNADAQAVLAEAVRAAVRLRRRLHVANERYVIAVVGLSNVGKSTLLNALLGYELAPRRNGPCTAAPIEFVSGTAFEVTAYHRRGLHRPHWECASVEAVHERLSALAVDEGAEASTRVAKVVVRAPSELLREGLILADTPGFGAAQLGDAQGSHESALKQYLQGEVSQVFWVVLAEQGIGKREKTFHDQLLADVCDDVIVTGSEGWNEQERARFRRHFGEAFQQRLPNFHFVSGLEGMQARASGDEDRLAAAGIPALESHIRAFVDPAGRFQATRQALLQLASDLTFWMNQLYGRQGRCLPSRWRPDSWGRWQDFIATNETARHVSQLLEQRA